MAKESNKQIFEVSLVVRGLDLEDDNQIAQIFTIFGNNLQVSGSPQNAILNLLLDTGDPINATTSAITQLESNLPDIEVLRVDSDLVAIPDIARRIDRTRENVRQFADGTRGPGGFPACVGVVGDAIRVWRWADVESWLRDNAGYSFPTLPMPTSAIDILNARLSNTRQLATTTVRDMRQDYILNLSAPIKIDKPAASIIASSIAWHSNNSLPDNKHIVAA